jgi:hypothetical protein
VTLVLLAAVAEPMGGVVQIMLEAVPSTAAVVGAKEILDFLDPLLQGSLYLLIMPLPH